VVCQILAQSIHWALLAQRSWRRNGARDAAAAGPPAAGDLGVLLAEADPQLLARAAGGQQRAAALAQAIAGKSFADYAALPRGEQRGLAERLLSFAHALCSEIDPTGVDTGRIWARRLLRLGVVMAGVGLLYLAGTLVADRVERAHDLARGKPWAASSRYPTYGCTSPAQECENSDVYFFSTDLEENPHIDWDLGKPQAVSGVRVDNRVDCCSDRAVPLVVEVSLDHVTWREVARRTEEFTTWKARFAPAQARWVRLRIPRRTLLHLVRVRILR
jgi:hypothetical protein